jgi:hypothetical protein
VEWAHRTAGARAAELWLAAAIGHGIGEVPEPAEKIRRARRARRHGWYAELWKSVVPVLHDVDSRGLDLVGGARDGDVDTVDDRVQDAYRLWGSEADVVAEAPILRVLELIERDRRA